MEETDPCARRVGTVLRDKWTLERLLGVGGMAAVYVARHKIGRVDAIKILHPEYARSEQVRARFEQEAHVLNRFRHPGAVEVRDLETTEDGAPFIVMELLEGQPLATRLRESPPSPEDALRVADEVLDVLAAAHAHGIIHRDIKPDNLFVLPDGSIKVLDFGIAQLRTKEASLKTKTGTTLGTVAYMPPEQLKGIDIDVRADVYGVGATMFRMLAGRAPHKADSDVELMMQVLSEPAPRLGAVLASVREDVARIVDRAIAFDRDARYPDARAMQADVRAARAEKNAKLVEPLPPQSEVATRTPAKLAAVEPAVIATSQPTMLAAPESALLREAAPASRLPTAHVVVSPAAIERTQVSGAEVARIIKRDVAGVPLVWVLVAGGVILLCAGALVTALAVAALRPRETAPSATASVASSAPVDVPSAPPESESVDEPPRHEPPPHPDPHHHPPPPHGHGPHKP